MTVKIKLTFPDLKAKIEKYRDEIDLFIAANMQFNRGMLFDQEGSYNGHKKWAPLKMRTGQILSKSGALRKSMSPNSGGRPGPGGIVEFRGEKITIGTSLIYAGMMNWGTTKLPGGVLRPKNAQALKIPLPGGKGARSESGKYMYRKSVKIPARRYDDWTEQDQNELSVALRNKLVEVLNR